MLGLPPSDSAEAGLGEGDRGSVLRRNEQYLCLALAHALAWVSSSAMYPSCRSAALDPPPLLALLSLWSRPHAGWAATTRCIGFLRM